MAQNSSYSLLPSLARTSTTNVDIQPNTCHRAVTLYLDVTSAGTGGLVLDVRYHDPITGSTKLVAGGAPAIIATGMYVFQLGPAAAEGAGTDVHGAWSLYLPPLWSVTITHLDGSSWTYSLGAGLTV